MQVSQYTLHSDREQPLETRENAAQQLSAMTNNGSSVVL